MLDSLDPNSRRVVRKHFEENNIPFTAENLAKFAGSDAQRQVFIYDAVNEGMSHEAANELYDNVQRSIAVAPTPVEPGPRASDEELSEYAEDLRIDKEEAKQVAELPLGVGETLGEPKPPQGESFDEFTVQEQPKREGEAWVDDFNYVTRPEDEPFPQDPVDKPINQLLGRPSPLELPKSDKPTTDYKDPIGSGFETDTPNTATPADNLTKALDKTKPHVEDEVDEKTGAMLKGAVQRPSEKEGAFAVGTTPGQQLRVGEPGAREPKELFNKITNTPGLSQQEMMIAFSAADKLMNATKEKPAELTPQEKLVLGKVNLPSLGDGTPANLESSKQTQKESVQNKFIDPRTQEEFWKAYQEYDTAREQQAAKDNTEEKENMRDMMFAARARGVGAKKDYTEGLSAIDKKKFLDGIVKGFGQIVAGTTGHMTGTDVGGRFKYDLTDFGPREKQLTDVYNTALKEVGDEVKMLQDNLTKMDKESASKRVDTLKDRLEMLIKFAGLTQTKSSMSTEAETKYAGLYQQMQDLIKTLVSIDRTNKMADRPPMSVSITDQRTEVKEGTEKEKEEAVQLTTAQLNALNDILVRFSSEYDKTLMRIQEPSMRMAAIQKILGPTASGATARAVTNRMNERFGIAFDRWADFKRDEVEQAFSESLADVMRDMSRKSQASDKQTRTQIDSVRTRSQGDGTHTPPPQATQPSSAPTPTLTPTEETKAFKDEAQLKAAPGVGLATKKETGIGPGTEWLVAANPLYDGASVGGAIESDGKVLQLFILKPGKRTEVKRIPIDSKEAQAFIESRR
jgi:hypothetical protein